MTINTLGENSLSGQDAIEALNLYIQELENKQNSNQKIEKLDIRIRMAKALSKAIRNLEYEGKEETNPSAKPLA